MAGADRGEDEITVEREEDYVRSLFSQGKIVQLIGCFRFNSGTSKPIYVICKSMIINIREWEIPQPVYLHRI